MCISSFSFWISAASGHDGRMTGLAWFTTASVQTGDSFEEVAAFLMLTDTPPLE